MIYPQATAPLAVANPLFGLGLGLSRSSLATETTFPTIANLQLNLRRTQFYTDTGCTASAAVGQTCKGWKDLQSGNNATESTNPPTVAAGPSIAAGANIILSLTSNLALTGDFTIYAIATYSAGATISQPVGNVGNGSFIGRYSDGQVYIKTDAGSGGSASLTLATRMLTQYSRTGTTVNFRGTGIPFLSLPGSSNETLTLASILKSPYGSSNSGFKLEDLWVVSAYNVGSADETLLIDWIEVNREKLAF